MNVSVNIFSPKWADIILNLCSFIRSNSSSISLSLIIKTPLKSIRFIIFYIYKKTNMKKIKLYLLLISFIFLKSCKYERKGVVLHKIYKEKEEYQTHYHNPIVMINHTINEKYILIVNELNVNGYGSTLATELKIVEVPEINFKNTEVGDTIYFSQ